jgi:hypothetical protein
VHCFHHLVSSRSRYREALDYCGEPKPRRSLQFHGLTDGQGSALVWLGGSELSLTAHFFARFKAVQIGLKDCCYLDAKERTKAQLPLPTARATNPRQQRKKALWLEVFR